MSELSSPPNTLLLNSAQVLTQTAQPATDLPLLGSPPDMKFLGYDTTTAGRAVLIELYAPENAPRHIRERTWRTRVRTVNVEGLGRAARMLELAGINWRQARYHNEIFSWAVQLLKRSAS